MASDAAWRNVCREIETHDPWCRGIVVLGLDAPEDALATCFAVASGHPLVKGFAVGRTIFADAARAWLAGTMDDQGAVAEMAARFQRLCDAWQAARCSKGDAA